MFCLLFLCSVGAILRRLGAIGLRRSGREGLVFRLGVVGIGLLVWVVCIGRRFQLQVLFFLFFFPLFFLFGFDVFLFFGKHRFTSRLEFLRVHLKFSV